MPEVITIGLDIAKTVFHAHGAAKDGVTSFSKGSAGGGKVLAVLVEQPGCIVALEACGSDHYWAPELMASTSVDPTI